MRLFNIFREILSALSELKTVPLFQIATNKLEDIINAFDLKYQVAVPEQ
jgi:hypothetical protein